MEGTQEDVDVDLSVIIPTYNRAALLESTLHALFERQTGQVPRFEVIVVDDGSTDGTGELLEHMVLRYAPLVRRVYQQNQRQAVARNHGMRLGRGRLFVFLQDDTLPHEAYLDRHWGRYVAEGCPRRYAAIGRTVWHPRIRTTPFREWINEWGLQFGFRLIVDPQDVPFNFFYTSNLTFSRDLYDDLGGFNESFRGYGWEDIELGYRYQTVGGMRLRYLDDALAYHHHNLTVTGFCRRQERVGYAAMIFYALHPELREFLKVKPVHPVLRLFAPPLDIAAYTLQVGDEQFGFNLNRMIERVLARYYELGLLRAQQERTWDGLVMDEENAFHLANHNRLSGPPSSPPKKE